MKFNRINAVIMRHFYEAKHNFDQFLDIVYWPVLDVIVWGFLTVYLTNNQGINVTAILMGAVVLWGAFYSFQRDIAIGFLHEIWAKNLLNLFSTPLTVWEYITGLITINFIKMMLGFLLASLLAWLVYSFNIFSYALLLLPYFLNLILFGLAVGIFITGLIFRYNTKIQGFAWGFAGILSPISCVFYPLTILPKSLQYFAVLLPTTHSFEGMRQILFDGSFSWLNFWWGLVLSLIYIVISIIFFKKIFSISKKRGLLVKLE